jgi:hypothetical protein
MYAGMGMWEGVVNCYRYDNGKYYVASLLQNSRIGKPGEEVDGKILKADELKKILFDSLHDTTNVVVKEFNAVLSSIQIQREGEK